MRMLLRSVFVLGSALAATAIFAIVLPTGSVMADGGTPTKDANAKASSDLTKLFDEYQAHIESPEFRNQGAPFEPSNLLAVLKPCPPLEQTLAFSVQPSNLVAGDAFSPVIQVEVLNASGTRITTATNTITLAIKANPGSGVLLGTTTASAVNGVDTFSGLKIEKSGAGYTRVALTLDALSTTSPQFTISVGTSSKLAFTVQPSNGVTNTAIAPAVEVDVQDSVGNTLTTATPAVNVIIGNNPQARIWWEPRQGPQQTRVLCSQPCHSTALAQDLR